MKKIFVAAIIVLVAAAYAVGSYFVGFALKRGEDLSPPPATANIADPNLVAPSPPNFSAGNLSLQSFDGIPLHAKIFTPEENSNRWAILVHGYGRDGRFAFDYAEEYLKRGWNVLIPDLRASGQSGGEFITMGALESRDVCDWAKKISDAHPDAKIILHGVSMGAATVMMSAAQNPPDVVAVVEDCGYTSAYEMFAAQLKKIFGLPEFPAMNCANVVCKIKTGVKISDAAPIDVVEKISVPILFIHGDADELVPVEMQTRLFEACASPKKEIFVVHEAGHADAKRKNPAAYFDRVFAFLNGVIQ